MLVAKPRRLLFDTNVWVDYYLGTPEGDGPIAALIEHGVRGDVDVLFTPTSAKDLFYLIPRRLRSLQGDAVGSAPSYAPAAWACLSHLMEVATAVPLALPECELAHMLRHRFFDFEDNLILAATETAGADYVVTNDRVLLKQAPEACVAPTRALELVSGDPFCR